MNCKPGDLAVVVDPGNRAVDAGLLGRVVRVISLADARHGWSGGIGPQWYYEGPEITLRYGGLKYTFHAIADCVLKPLRDDGGEDETLRIAGKPQEHVLARLDALHKQMDDHMRRLREVAEKVQGVREAVR